MSALKPYPHYEINVKDNSIYRFAVDEILPVHRPLWVLHTQEGPVGDPVWCPTASYLKKKFGEQTINLANKKFASPQAFFLNQTMSYDGAFIVRALPADATYATAILYADVTITGIVQYQLDENPESPTYGMRLTDNDTDSENYGKYIPVEGPAGIETGVKIRYYVRPANKQQIDAGLDSLEPIPTATSTAYPILAFKALYPGEYGNDLAFRFFYKASENSAANSALYKTIFNSMSVSRREYNSSTTNIIFDIYGRGYNTFSADPECADPETGVQMDMDNVITNAFDVDSAEGSDFPFTVYTYEKNIKTIGDLIIETEQGYNSGRSLAFEEFGYSSAGEMNGYQINILSGENIKGVPYDHVAISGRVDVDPEIVFTYSETEDTEFKEFEDATVDNPVKKIYYKGVPVPEVSNAVKYIKLVPGIDYQYGDAIVPNPDKDDEIITYEPITGTFAANKEYYVHSWVALSKFAVGDTIPGIGILEKVITGSEISYEQPGAAFEENKEYVTSAGDPIALIGEHIPSGVYEKVSTESYITYEPASGNFDANKNYFVQTGDFIVLSGFHAGDTIPSGVYEKVNTVIHHYDVYERTEQNNTEYYNDQSNRILLDKDFDIYLEGGSDGSLQAEDPKDFEEVRDDFVDHFFYNFLKLRINPKIVDKFRYPFTHLYDPGYSMTTKYAMLDFLDTRDDVAVELATQVLFPSEWATGFKRKIKLNDQAKDMQDGMVLRERALLMRESVLKGTDCMRASIFPQAGKPVAATYTKPVPFTFWSAMKHAMYGNTDRMSAQEPRGLPYSYNEMFKSWNWTNYSELLKEKTWNAGLNYCQYADMKRIFYPALRTVYREETSVLVDQWVVDALVYTKHECRKAWARFSGRNDKQAVLEQAIKVYLEDTLAYLYNGKYDFSVSVYKTEEEQKLGYIEHVKLSLVFPATMRVINFDIEVNREGYTPESEG